VEVDHPEEHLVRRFPTHRSLQCGPESETEAGTQQDDVIIITDYTEQQPNLQA
jgi:hypothetical protein